MSASVQWVPTRTTVAPARCASLRSRTLPTPGSSRVATFAFRTAAATASIHSRSVCAPNPYTQLEPDSPSPWATSIESTPAASGARDRGRLLDAVLVAHGVHAVAQGDIADIDLLIHAVAPAVWVLRAWRAKRSAVALAADVMMSRFPAYAGR